MAQANEITIRVSSPLLFIDDDASSAEPTARESFQSLTVVKRSPSSSSDTSPAMARKPKPENERKSRLELTIKGENTIINIQTVKSAKQIKHDTDVDEIYELINQSVQQIFQSPGKEEIEKALESAGFQERKFTKKGVWKMLSKSAKASSSSPVYTEEERYPSIVLLQEPPIDDDKDEKYFDGKPKFEYRSRSMMSLRDITPRSLEFERSNLEKEKKSIEVEREGLEQGKTNLEREKRSLERSKSFFIQDCNILKEKKQVLRQVKESTDNKDGGLLNKEKLCLELERQLLEDEKKIITEEHEILGKEKEMIEKERNILGSEKNVLNEERFILGKEKHVIERQKSESGIKINDQSDVLSEIEDVFQQACEISPHPCRHFNFPSYGSYNPVYVPVYNLPRPYFSPCCPKKSKTVQTQTEVETFSSAVADAGVPFELLFPRVVITTFPESDNSRTVIKELTEPAKAGKKPLPKKPQRKLTNISKNLQIPRADLSLKAATKKPKPLSSRQKGDKRNDEPETEEESGIQTMTTTSEGHLKDDDNSAGTAETIETLHFGFADDFYSNEAIFPGKRSTTDDDNDAAAAAADDDGGVIGAKQLPLTTVGYDMFEKLTQLSLERDSVVDAVAAPEGNEPIDKKLNSASNLNLHVSGCGGSEGIAITLPGNISLFVKSQKCCETMGASDLTSGNFKDDGKLLVKRSDLWHADTNLSQKQYRPPTGLSFHITDGFNISLSTNEPETAKPEGINLFIQNSCGREQQSNTAAHGNQQPSPRTADLLKALGKKLALNEAELNLTGFGRQKNLEGLYFIRRFTDVDDYRPKPQPKRETTAQPREYLCEECLTTMRLYEDDFHTVQDLVDKFENLNRFK